MTDDPILTDRRDGNIVTLTLNRPKARNSLSLQLLSTLHDAIEAAGTDPDIHVIIISAAGPVFCAGHDLKELTNGRANADKGAAFFAETMQACARLMMAIVACPKPVVACVQGTATAAGCQLVASCDLAVAAETAHFATPGVNIGLFCSTPMVALSRNIGRKQAMKMLLTGQIVDAPTAQTIGLVNDVVSPEKLTQATEALARQIAEKSPATLRIGKQAFYRQIEMPLPDAYAFTSEVMVMNMLEPDAREGIGAFLEKRAPHWNPLSPEN